MSDEPVASAPPQPGAEQPAAPQAERGSPEVKRIYLVSYPKVVFLYPTLIAALIAGCYSAFSGGTPDEPATEIVGNQVVAKVFMLVLAVNLVVLSFDFPRTTSLTLFFFIVAMSVVAWSLFEFNNDLLEKVSGVLNALRPYANAPFYFCIAAVLVVLYIGVLISVQFDYWEVRPNELLHHHGILSDLERFSAPSLRIDKEINDVFEYLLLRSGRLIVHPSNERRAIVLENVFFINKREGEITRMLGALQVQVRTDQHS